MNHHIIVPLRVNVRKRTEKFFALNLNSYRNTHFQELNNSKIIFKDLITSQVQQLPEMQKVKLVLRLFPKTKRLCDLDNVLSIVTKYTQDVLVTLGKLPEDNYNHIPEIDFRFGHVDKEDPRVEITITEI